jgi:hypothetical protein
MNGEAITAENLTVQQLPTEQGLEPAASQQTGRQPGKYHEPDNCRFCRAKLTQPT